MTDLELAESLCALLKPHGEVTLEYISAELQPFSSQQKPGLVFVPASGGHSGQTIFIEIKLSPKLVRGGQAYGNLLEHRHFATEALDQAISRYLYVTNLLVPEFSKKLLKEGGVCVIDSVEDEMAVINRLMELGLLPKEWT